MPKKLIEQLRWWASECDRTNFGCQARKLLLEAADALEETKPKRGRCDYCRGASYSEKPFKVITHRGLEKDVLFNHCPNCGADMREVDDG